MIAARLNDIIERNYVRNQKLRLFKEIRLRFVLTGGGALLKTYKNLRNSKPDVCKNWQPRRENRSQTRLENQYRIIPPLGFDGYGYRKDEVEIVKTFEEEELPSRKINPTP